MLKAPDSDLAEEPGLPQDRCVSPFTILMSFVHGFILWNGKCTIVRYTLRGVHTLSHFVEAFLFIEDIPKRDLFSNRPLEGESHEGHQHSGPHGFSGGFGGFGGFHGGIHGGLNDPFHMMEEFFHNFGRHFGGPSFEGPHGGGTCLFLWSLK